MIEQVRFSEAIEFFEKDFMRRWPSLNFYRDYKSPCLFIGAYRKDDIRVIKSHKGFKLIWLTGADRKNISEIKNAVFVAPGRTEYDWLLLQEVRTKQAYIQLKDFSNFPLTMFGDKVYCYIRDGVSYNKFKHELIEEIQKKIDFEILTGYTKYNKSTAKKQRSIVELKRDFYDKSFVNLRLNEFCGGLSEQEMAHMGRKSITNRYEPYSLQFDSVGDIVNHINNESKKIGTMPNNIITHDMYVGDEWMDEKYWEV